VALVNSTTDTLKNLGYEKGQTGPGLVVLHDIRPGNGADVFLQPRSLHGALGVLSRNVSVTRCSNVESITTDNQCNWHWFIEGYLTWFDSWTQSADERLLTQYSHPH